MARATFGAGCFWGVEEAFRRQPGVIDTAVGYMGGHVDHPSYPQVCSGETGHAEIVQVQFDPTRVDYDELLNLFFSIHDPTQVNRQGWDVGSQYRSAIFVHDDAQRAAAQAAKERLAANGHYRRPVATEIVPADTFWRAEEYHQRYLEKNGGAGCHI